MSPLPEFPNTMRWRELQAPVSAVAYSVEDVGLDCMLLAGAWMVTGSWRWKGNSTRCRTDNLNVSKGLQGPRRRGRRLGWYQGPGSQPFEERSSCLAGRPVKGRNSGSLAGSRMTACFGGQTNGGAATTRSTPGTRHERGRSYTQKRQSDSQARSTFVSDSTSQQILLCGLRRTPLKGCRWVP